jgi:hypothetical protein
MAAGTLPQNRHDTNMRGAASGAGRSPGAVAPARLEFADATFPDATFAAATLGGGVDERTGSAACDGIGGVSAGDGAGAGPGICVGIGAAADLVASPYVGHCSAGVTPS